MIVLYGSPGRPMSSENSLRSEASFGTSIRDLGLTIEGTTSNRS
jgi:hypothetical protein